LNTSPRACLFRLGTQLFALPGEYTRQVHTVSNLRPIPKAPAILRGLFPVRSNVLPLVTLEPLLGIEAVPLLGRENAPLESELAVQMEFEGRELAFGVTEVIGFNPLERGSLKPVPLEMGRMRELSSGVFLHGGEPVLVLDVEKLMLALSRAFGVVRVVA
jgi:purine-binding chemotaxis protein CheW